MTIEEQINYLEEFELKVRKELRRKAQLRKEDFTFLGYRIDPSVDSVIILCNSDLGAGTFSVSLEEILSQE